MSKEHWEAIEQREASVDQWNKQVEQVIEAEGTFTAERDHDDISEGFNKRVSRKYHIELDREEGFVGWWDDDHSQMTLADTPFEVLCDLP